MRHAVRLMIIACLVLTGDAWAKRRPPVPCPSKIDMAAELRATCPCAGRTRPDGSVAPWRNHGGYVSCVAHFRNKLRKRHCLTRDDTRTMGRCAAHSTCGKPKLLLCCVVETGTCNDPVQGDLALAGTCSNDPTLACDSDVNCIKSIGHIVRDEASCTSDGGVIGMAGSVCDRCVSAAP
jgi:hypothetical protein